MRRIFVTGLLAAALAFAGSVSQTITISPQDLSFTRVNGYDVISFTKTPSGLVPLWTTEPGSPLLPVLSGNVLIPAGAVLERIVIKRTTKEVLDGNYTLYPVQPMRPLSQFAAVPFVEPNPVVYSSAAAYPTEPLTAVPAGTKTGFRIAGFLLCPFEYQPKSGKLTLWTQVELEVSYQENTVSVQPLTPDQLELAQADVAQLVLNRSDVRRMAPPVYELDGPELDVIIVTAGTLQPALAGFRNYLLSKGYFTEIVPTETIYARYPGRDNPEKIRNMLKEKFSTQGLKYVILAGDVQHVPCRTGYLPYSPYNVPADLYFADLDGTWDANNNNQFGEYSYTNFNPDSVDLFSDITVGRLPLDDATHCANFLAKDTLYECHPDTAYLNNVLLPFEALWSNIDYYGRIVNKNIALALSRMSSWQVDSMLNMPPATCVASINAGRHLFHFAGHGSYNAFGSTFSTSNLASLTNVTKPCIVNSMACDCGNFDQYDCLGEQFINITNGGAVSTCLNARYGWGAPPNMGPSENLCMEFYNNYIKGMPQGRAYALAKDFYRNAAFSQMTYRWSLYDWTFQGDPTMLLWRTVPQPLAVSFPDTLTATPQVVMAHVEKGGQPLFGARVALLHAGQLVGRGVTNSLGSASVSVAGLQDTWTLQLRVTGPDGQPFTKPVSVRSGGPSALVTYSHNWVLDANGRLDPDDNVDLFVVVKNNGNAAAPAATGTLHSLSPYVTLTDSTSSYGNLAVGDTARGDAYHVVVSRTCPQGHRAEFVLTVTASDGQWPTLLELPVGRPHARGGLWAVHDTADFVLGVCANGGIGTTTWRGEGLGFIYSKSRMWSSSALMHGSLLLGILYPDTNWVCDNYYGAPAWQVTPQEFALVESLRPVIPAELGDQEFRGIFSDANHPSPKHLSITQRSYVSAITRHKDFAILEYRIHNHDSLPLTSLYVGVCCDFRTAPWNSNDQYDYAGTDSARKLAYIKSASSGETLALGVRHIYPAGVNGYANCINQSTYIADGFTKTEKMRFMDGRLRQTQGTTVGNWHAMVSSGPYAILPGDSQIVAFVICGARTAALLTTVSDTAEAWYTPPVALNEGEIGATALVRALEVRPKLFSSGVTIRYSLSQLRDFDISVYDAAGRVIDRFTVRPTALTGTYRYKPATIQNGIYFLRAAGQREKLIRME